MDDDQSETQPGMAGTVGEQLRVAREAQGFTIADVAERTRIPSRHLTMIESGELDELPAPTYSVGFVKTYARLLGLDSQALALQFRRQISQAAPRELMISPYEPADPARTPSRALAWTCFAVAALLICGYLYWRGITAEKGATLAAQTQDHPAPPALVTPPALPVAPVAPAGTVPPPPRRRGRVGGVAHRDRAGVDQGLRIRRGDLVHGAAPARRSFRRARRRRRPAAADQPAQRAGRDRGRQPDPGPRPRRAADQGCEPQARGLAGAAHARVRRTVRRTGARVDPGRERRRAALIARSVARAFILRPSCAKRAGMILLRMTLASLLLATAAPVFAADPPPIGTRVDRIEKELRAVQRKVFPGGAPAFSEPEIAAVPSAGPTAGSPATEPLNDLTARVAGIEREVARMTNQLEQDEHRLTLLSEQAAQDRTGFEARLKALEGGAPLVAAAVAPGAVPPPADLAGSPFRTAPSTKPGRPTRPVVAPADDIAPVPMVPAAGPSADSADPAEAAYMAAYRLWVDKKFAAAEDALGKVAAQYPKHRRASYARNLQGRAFLDDGQPAEAARALYANYQKDPRGERAPESLFYLGDALTKLKKTDDACRAYGELETVYGAKMGEGLRGRLPAARKAAGCSVDPASADDAPAKTVARPAAGSSAAKKKK